MQSIGELTIMTLERWSEGEREGTAVQVERASRSEDEVTSASQSFSLRVTSSLSLSLSLTFLPSLSPSLSFPSLSAGK